MIAEATTTDTVHEVASHEATNAKLQEIVKGEDYTLGSGYDYPRPFAVFYLDAWSGEGMGNLVLAVDGNLYGCHPDNHVGG
jgi:hypothetical protein